MKRFPWHVACAVAALASLPPAARAQEAPAPAAPAPLIPTADGRRPTADAPAPTAPTADTPASVAVFPFPQGTDVEPEWRVGAYLMNQTGAFVARDKTVDALKFSSDGKPVPGNDLVPESHGNNFGHLSMCRFTFQMDADWRPTKRVWTHVTLRLSRSLTLPADEQAQVPVAGYNGDGNESRRRNWVRDTYYNETSVREFFVNLRAAPWLDLRVGRQIVAWGESGNSRLLDVVNPVDSTWHFSAFENEEDQRMPLWMVRVLADIPALRGGLDIVWVPMLPLMERPEDTVTVPLTFVGAWGLPTPNKQIDDSVSARRLTSKTLDIPHKFGVDSRVGFRWKGSAGPSVNYSIMYYWTHQLSPPVPTYLRQPITGYDAATGSYSSPGMFDVSLAFPRQHVIGFSLEGQVPFPLGTMLKLEATLEPDRTYALTSNNARVDLKLTNNDTIEQQRFRSRRMLTLQYAVTLQQPFWIRPVNREEPFILVFQFLHTVVPGVKELDLTNAPVAVPGYDTTVVTKNSFQVVGALFTTFLKGMITPKIVAGFLPRTEHLVYAKDPVWKYELKHQSSRHGSGFASFSLAVKLFDSWRATVAYNRFFGDDPYDGLGFFRDRDEVNVAVKYQF